MRVISIFSIAFLSLTVWGLFLTLLNQSNDLEFQVESAINDQEIEHVQAKLEEDSDQADEIEAESDIDVDETEVDQDSDLDAAEDEFDQANNEVESIQVAKIEDIPTTIEARASSRHNDILYDFEKENPISVDDLLSLLVLN